MAGRAKSNSASKGSILFKDLTIVGVSIIVAFIIGKTGMVHAIVGSIDASPVLTIFIAGMFFTSMFTIAPAAVALAEVAQGTPAGTVMIWGALGAVIGDLILFLFIRDGVAEDFKAVLKGKYLRKIRRWSHFGFMRWLGPAFGALLIASPLPDEIGLAMMGMSRVKTPIFIPVVFVMNMIGIYFVIILGRGI